MSEVKVFDKPVEDNILYLKLHQIENDMVDIDAVDSKGNKIDWILTFTKGKVLFNDTLNSRVKLPRNKKGNPVICLGYYGVIRELIPSRTTIKSKEVKKVPAKASKSKKKIKKIWG